MLLHGRALTAITQTSYAAPAHPAHCWTECPAWRWHQCWPAQPQTRQTLRGCGNALSVTAEWQPWQPEAGQAACN